MMRLTALHRWVLAACALLLFGAPMATTAAAGEELLIPFQCATSGDRVLARPSGDQSLAILGPRTTEPYRACPQDGGGGCRTIMLHKFDVDCGGTRVSWQKLYAAISQVTTRGAEFDRGKLVVMVRPGREPRSQTPDRFDRSAAVRRGGPFPVEMPDGFAPVTGTVARFAGIPDRPPQRVAERPKPQPRNAAVPSPARPEPKTAVTPPPSRYVAKVPETSASVVVPKPPQKVESPRPVPNPEKPQLPKVIAPSAKAKPEVAKAQPAEVVENKGKPEPAGTDSVTPVPAAAVKPTVINVPDSVGQSKTLPTRNSDDTTKSVRSKGTTPVSKAANDGATDDKSSDVAAANDQADPSAEVIAGGTNNIYSESDRFAPFSTTETPSYAAPTLGATVLVLIIVATILTLLWAFYRRMTTARTPKTRPLRKAPPVRAVPSKVAKAEPKKVERSEPALSLSKPEDTASQPSSNALDAGRPSMGGLKPDLSSAKFEGAVAATSDAPKLSLAPDKPEHSNLDKRIEFSAKSFPTLPMPEGNVPDATPSLDDAKAEQVVAGPGHPAHVTPETRDEALSTLGVSSKARPDVIKKVVEGLRESWKTELAIDEVDRRHRQERLAQIEAAWQLLRDDATAAAKKNGAAGADRA